AVDVRQLHIEDEAGWQVGLVAAHILARRAKGDSAYSMRFKQLAERFADTRVVIDDKDDMVVRRHAAGFISIGNVKMNIAPRGSFFSAHDRPPRESTIARHV